MTFTSNMVGKDKEPTIEDQTSDSEYSPGSAEILAKPEGVYQQTCMKTGLAIPIYYEHLAGLITEAVHFR